MKTADLENWKWQLHSPPWCGLSIDIFCCHNELKLNTYSCHSLPLVCPWWPPEDTVWLCRDMVCVVFVCHVLFYFIVKRPILPAPWILTSTLFPTMTEENYLCLGHGNAGDFNIRVVCGFHVPSWGRWWPTSSWPPPPLLLTDCQVPSPPMTPSRRGRRNESTSSTTSQPRALQQLQRWPSCQGHLILVSRGEGFPQPNKLQWCRRTRLQWSQVRWSWRTWLRWSQVRWSWRTQLRWSQRSPQSCLISLLP